MEQRPDPAPAVTVNQAEEALNQSLTTEDLAALIKGAVSEAVESLGENWRTELVGQGLKLINSGSSATAVPILEKAKEELSKRNKLVKVLPFINTPPSAECKKNKSAMLYSVFVTDAVNKPLSKNLFFRMFRFREPLCCEPFVSFQTKFWEA